MIIKSCDVKSLLVDTLALPVAKHAPPMCVMSQHRTGPLGLGKWCISVMSFKHAHDHVSPSTCVECNTPPHPNLLLSRNKEP